MSILPDNWTTVLDAISSGAVQCFHFAGVNFSALSEDAFLIAVGRRGLQALVVRHSAISGKCVTDDLIRASAAKGLRRLIFNNNADAPPRFSEDAILDFFFRADAAQGGQWLSLELTGSGFTQMFLFKFFEVRDCLVLNIALPFSRKKLQHLASPVEFVPTIGKPGDPRRRSEAARLGSVLWFPVV